jgi:hypothetical protein
VRVADKCVPV